MTPHELATKIAEEVFKAIESERAIIKAHIVEAVEKVLLLSKAQPVIKMERGEWVGLRMPCEFASVSVADDVLRLPRSWGGCR
jgi:hypothetical protein